MNDIINKANFSICSDTEFNPLRSIIVGSPFGANHPNPNDRSFENFFLPPKDRDIRSRVLGPIGHQVLQEVEEDLIALIKVLEQLNVKIFRPDCYDSAIDIKSPDWTTQQLYSLMPRDCFLIVGRTVIEVPSPTRSRYFETFPFRHIFYEHRKYARFRWLAAPKPRLLDENYGEHILDEKVIDNLNNKEILFDGANCIRIGRDIFIDINRSANRMAADWLQFDVLGDSYKVHTMSIGLDHADVTLVPIRPGLLLVDPKRVNKSNLPCALSKWDLIKLKETVQQDFGLLYPMASNGIGRNLLMIDHNTAIVESSQLELIKELELRSINVIPIRYRHGRTLGGSFHCVTLDLYREGDGEGQSYV